MDLVVAGWIERVWSMFWHFGKHFCEEHVETCVFFDEVFEFNEDWVEGFWVVMDVEDLFGEPGVVDTVVWGEPLTCSV